MSGLQAYEKIISAIASADIGNINLMEVCGTHTMSIAKSGLKSILPGNIRLLSGPGCPVCVTPDEVMDAVLDLAVKKDVIIVSYGDMIRVPGSRRGITLRSLSGAGADCRIVYSAMDAVKLAEITPEKEIVFLGVGFETTAPGTAAAVISAVEAGLKNFSVLSLLKTVEPALRALIAEEGFNVQGFICPGHVATIIGENGFRFLAEEFHIPGVISGFEADDILVAIYRLVRQVEFGRAQIENEYTRAVAADGNQAARQAIKEVFEPCDSLWRGLGMIPLSGLRIKEKYKDFDTEARFGIHIEPLDIKTPCRCGDVISGKADPADCPLFGSFCTPEDPAGPCMVSSEGACAAAYRYAM